MTQPPASLTTDTPIESANSQDDPKIDDFLSTESLEAIGYILQVFFDDWSANELDFEGYGVCADLI